MHDELLMRDEVKDKVAATGKRRPAEWPRRRIRNFNHLFKALSKAYARCGTKQSEMVLSHSPLTNVSSDVCRAKDQILDAIADWISVPNISNRRTNNQANNNR